MIVRSDGRIAVVLPKDLDPERKPRYGPGERQRWASVEAATAWLDAEIIARRRPPPQPGGPDESVRHYLARWWTSHAVDWPPRTAANYRRAIRHFSSLGGLRVGDLIDQHERILDALRALATAAWRRQKRGPGGVWVAYGPSYPYTPSTIRQARAVLHTALQALVPHVLPYNPVKRHKLARRQEAEQPVWDAEQVDRFEAKALELRPDLYFPIRLVTRRALRRGEVVALKADDLDMRRRVVRVDETAGDRAGDVDDTKGRKRRDIPLGELAEDARQHRLRTPRPSRWLVPGQRGDKPFSLRQFNAVVRQIAEAAGLEPITPKDMRATAATILLDQNVSLARVSRLLGHSTIAVTARFYDRIQRSPQTRVDQLADDFDRAFRQASDAVPGTEADAGMSLEVSREDLTR